MSGLFKGIKKVFKKVTKFVKRYWKQIVIAAAIVFTAGVAMGYFGAAAAAGGGAAAGTTAATTAAAGGGTVFGAAGGAAALGVTEGVGALGLGTGGLMAGGTGAGLAAAGTGAATIGSVAGGAGGMIAGGSAAGSAAITTLPTMTVTATSGLGAGAGAFSGQSLVSTIGASALSGAGASFSKAATEVAPQAETPSETGDSGLEEPKKGWVGKTVDAYKGMSSFEKMSLLSTGVQMASALAAPKQEDKTNEFPMQESFYARDKDGNGPGAAIDYDKANKQFVRGGPMGGVMAAPEEALQAEAPKAAEPRNQQAPNRTPVPESFIARDTGRDDELDRRMKFIQGGS